MPDVWDPCITAMINLPGYGRSVADRLRFEWPAPCVPSRDASLYWYPLACSLSRLSISLCVHDGPLRRPLCRYTAHVGGSATPVATAP
jgi:hypothetical protein